ncbi:hypothetical protein AOLI_G00067240 [Acnodon oligacanthus]
MPVFTSVASAPSAADSGVSVRGDGPPEIALEFSRREHRPSSRYAEAGDVACGLCEGRKLRACKSCMACLASFCEAHVRHHYTVEALQRHLLVEVTKNLIILQENAQLKKTIKEECKENQALRKENEALKQKITELRLSKYLCETRTASR